MAVAFVFVAILSGLAGAVTTGVMTGSILLAILAYIGFGSLGMFASVAVIAIRAPRDWDSPERIQPRDVPRFDIAAE